MICPKCKGKTRVVETRFYDIENEIYRRRKCIDCDNSFFTVEFEVEENEVLRELWKTVTAMARCGK